MSTLLQEQAPPRGPQKERSARPSSALVRCRHCELPFRPAASRPDFCCSGCEYVFNLIHGENLETFYALRGGPGQPVGPAVFQQRDYAWLAEAVGKAEAQAAASQAASATYGLQGISCVGCVWLIEKLAAKFPGVVDVRVQSSLGRIHLKWQRGAFAAEGLARELQKFGYLLGPAGESGSGETGGLVVRMGLCAAFAMNAMLFTVPRYFGMEASFPFAALFDRLAFLMATLSLIVGGGYFMTRSVQGLRRGILHLDVPIALGIAVAYAASVVAWHRAMDDMLYFDFVSTFAFLMLVGRWRQRVAVERNRRRLLEWRAELPPVTLSGPAKGETRAAAAITPGLRYELAPGRVAPVASRLLSGGASAGMDWINGEAEARVVPRGEIIPSGAINLGLEAIELESLESWDQSLLSRLLQVEPRESRSRLMEQIIRYYLIAVLVVAVAGSAAWVLFTGQWPTALQVLVSVLVVSCPCAIGVALPLANELAVSRLRQQGVFVRSEAIWAQLRRIRRIVFDKTGTLTLESLVLNNPEALARLSAREAKALWLLVRESRHPVSACLRQELLARGLASPQEDAADRPQESVGFGLELAWEGGLWRLGRPEWAGGRSPEAAEGTGFSCDGRTIAAFAMTEEIRPDAAAEIGHLAATYPIYILSGDRHEKVEQTVRALGLPPENGIGRMTPAEKADWIEGEDREDTLYVGDGANDSLAFERAFCRGTPAADRGLLEHKADFYFLGNGIAGIRRLLETGRLRDRTVVSVLAFTTTYNLVAASVALAGWMSPLVAAVIMPASSLVSMAIAGHGLRRG